MTKVVVGIISRNNPAGYKEYLLISVKKDFGRFTGYYYPPGGHVEAGESNEVALIRELKEELGIAIEPGRLIHSSEGDVPDQITYWYECTHTGGEIIPNSEEVADFGYVPIQSMRSIPVWPSTLKFFDEFGEQLEAAP